ncbi:c-type cytochrome biogenesis protein CcmI [Endozoicomonas lisbonensis]|uniref:Cytochrome c-type biogenesis protein CcmH n=1 Tax=Endozoicomonas lisbonensis TaxID=3120522 RepID=A0ABV2SNT5_9GAMM
MTTFWLVTLLLVLLCMALVVAPFIGKDKSREDNGEVSDKETNIACFHEQRAEIKAQANSGLISQAEAEALCAELEKKLLTDVTGNESETAQTGSRKALPYALTVAILIPVLALPVYLKLGASVELNATSILRNPETTAEETLLSLEEWHRKRPDNVQAMFLLGDRYRANGQMDEAVTVYRQLYQTTDGHFQAAEQLAQALYHAGDRVMTDEIRRLVATTLAVDESNATALSLNGVDAFQQDNFEEAISLWNQALQVEQNTIARQDLLAGIREARQQLGIPAAEVRVKVTLAPELQTLPADARVIVFARASGERAPVAAVPMTVADLPREVTLDDNSAMMMHGGSLGDLQSLDLIGRVSLAGDISMPDYEGQVRFVEVGSTDVIHLEISPAS